MQEKSLQEVAHLNKAAEVVFNDFSKRVRFRDETNLKRYHRLLEEQYGAVNPDELMATFKALEKLGLGSIVVGRRKKPTRFVWHYNLKDVAAAARGEINADQINPLFNKSGKRIPRVPTAQPGKAEPDQTPAPKPVGQEKIDQVFENLSSQFDTEVIISKPGSGQIRKFKISPEKERLLMDLLNVFENGRGSK